MGSVATFRQPPRFAVRFGQAHCRADWIEVAHSPTHSVPSAVVRSEWRRAGGKLASRTSTSTHPRTADLRARKFRTAVARSGTTDRRPGRRTQEIQKGCRMAAWRETGKGGSTIVAMLRYLARVERRATRREIPNQGSTRARRHATLPIANPE